MISKSAGKVFTYSAENAYSDFMAKDIRCTDEGISYFFLSSDGLVRIKYGAQGKFNVYNSLAAVSAAKILGIDPSVSSEALLSMPCVKGRMEKISANGKDVYIDYAHTPDALKAVLQSLKCSKKGKTVCVFGCGGNRDKGKRSEMGRIASHFSDIVIVTTDNPREEDPADIVDDILTGVNNNSNIYIQLDREKAIALAIENSVPGDRILIAGKGHERSQSIGKEQKFFSDELTVRRLLGVL